MMIKQMQHEVFVIADKILGPKAVKLQRRGRKGMSCDLSADPSSINHHGLAMGSATGENLGDSEIVQSVITFKLTGLLFL